MKLNEVLLEAFGNQDTGKVFKNIISILSRRTGEEFSGQTVPVPMQSGNKKLWTILYLSDNKGIRFNWSSDNTSSKIASITVWPSIKSQPVVTQGSLNDFNLIEIVNLAERMLKGEKGDIEVEDKEGEKQLAIAEAMEVIAEDSLRKKAQAVLDKKVKTKNKVVDEPVEAPVKKGRGRPKKVKVVAAPVEQIAIDFGDPKLFSKETAGETFEKIESLIKLVDKGTEPALLVTGDPGLGKTHTVEATLEKLGYEKDNLDDVLEALPNKQSEEESADEEESDTPKKKIPKSAYKKVNKKFYVKISGSVASALNIYKVLYFANLRNKKSVVLFDDCDAVLEKGNSANILKAALDSKSERTISYISTKLGKLGLPQSFTLSAKVIFISNKHKEDIDSAIVSRTQVADVNFSLSDILDRIKQIMGKMDIPGAKMADKKIVYDFLKTKVFGNQQVQKVVKKFDFRTFMQIVSIKMTGNKNWQRWAAQAVISKFAKMPDKE